MGDTVVQQRVGLAPYTTLHIGGEARYFVTVNTIDEVKAAASFARQKKLPLFVLGSGSNVLFADDGYEGVVMQMKLLGRTYTQITPDTVELEVGAGEILDDVVADTVARGLWGLENLSAIPGTIGATPVQNVGAYGVEIGEYITAVTVVDLESGLTRVLTQAECQFGYRDSFFKHQDGKRYVVTSVTMRLTLRPLPRITYRDLATRFTDRIPSLFEIREAVIAIRSEKFPDWQVIGTAGSFFKNPLIPRAQAELLKTKYPDLPTFDTNDSAIVKVILGYILDKICNLKGVTRGRVGLFKHQALVLVAKRGATASEVTSFAEWVAAQVREKTTIEIEWEVNFIS